MSKFVNQIYPPHLLTTFPFGASSLHLIFPFSVATLRWARTHFTKDNFLLCYDPTLPSLFPSLHSPFEGSQRQLDMLEKRYFYHITFVIRHFLLLFRRYIPPLSLGEGRGEDSFSFASKPRF